MFGTTFLGHQGWLFSSGGTHILVDPILTEQFCDAGRVGELYPPRHFDAARFPRVDAVFFTHEHGDHFAVPTLVRMDRSIPIYLSARASRAARQILEELGFQVTPIAAGSKTQIGELEFHAFSPDHTRADNGDEWDVLPYLVRDSQGNGNFFTHVDVDPCPAVELALPAIADRPGLWGVTNNAGNWSFMNAGPRRAPRSDSAQLTAIVLQQYLALCDRWGPPAGLLWCGGGMSFPGERAWLNRNVFSADSARACAGLAAVVDADLHLVPAPGQTVWMEGGRILAVERSDFLQTAPEADWPSRTYVGDVAQLGGYEPACGRTRFEESALDELTAELADFARYLYGGPTFKQLLSLPSDAIEKRRATFALVLKADADSGAFVYEYDAHACAFRLVRSTRPIRDYLGGIECWASDLLDVCRGDLGPSAIPFGRARTFSSHSDLEISLGEYCLYFHPLRRPDRFLRLYRKQVKEEGSAEICVRAVGT